jgi:hypothetical protein
MKLGWGFLILVAGIVIAGAAHNVLFAVAGLIAAFIGWKIDTHNAYGKTKKDA